MFTWDQIIWAVGIFCLTFALSMALVVLGLTQAAWAEDAHNAAIYVVTYVEVMPPSQDDGVALLKRYREASRVYSALGDSTSSYYPGIQSDYNQNIVADPNNPRHVYLQLEEVFESTNGGTTWFAVGPYWNYDISCDPNNDTPYACPRTTHPDQHAGMIWAGQFWAGSDGGVWRRLAD